MSASLPTLGTGVNGWTVMTDDIGVYGNSCPGEGTNWLPAPLGHWAGTMRLHVPRAEVLEGGGAHR
jgi:hypothetical protein